MFIRARLDPENFQEKYSWHRFNYFFRLGLSIPPPTYPTGSLGISQVFLMANPTLVFILSQSVQLIYFTSMDLSPTVLALNGFSVCIIS